MTILDQISECIGAANVLIGKDTAKWRTDWTGAYTADPIAVLRPGSTQEVSQIITLADASRTPVVPVSGNTGLTGATSGTGMLMLSLERMNKIRRIDTAGRTAVVDAGVVLASLHAAADENDLIFPLTFGAKGSALIGGALSTNAGGSNVLRYGNARDLCLGVEVVMADGRVMDLMSALHKDNSGLNLKHLMIGAEGTLGIITGAVLRLFPKPLAYATAMVAVPSLEDALGLLHQLQDATGGAVEAFEYMPAAYITQHMRLKPGSRAPFDELHEINIMVEVGATAARDATPGPDGKTPIGAHLETILGQMLENGAVLNAVVAQNDAQRAEMWKRRDDAGEITFQEGPFVNSDVAVPLDKVAAFLAEATRRVAAIDPNARELVVAHLGDGNIHHTAYITRNDPDIKEAIITAIEDIAQEMRGSFSAEHGVGISKLGTMSRRKDPVALDAMRAIKAALDPNNILNPGKMIPG